MVICVIIGISGWVFGWCYFIVIGYVGIGDFNYFLVGIKCIFCMMVFCIDYCGLIIDNIIFVMGDMSIVLNEILFFGDC